VVRPLLTYAGKTRSETTKTKQIMKATEMNITYATKYIVKESVRHANYRMWSDGQNQEKDTEVITLKRWEMDD
jgi:hypothetical protein